MSHPPDPDPAVWPPAPVGPTGAGIAQAEPLTWLERLAAAPRELACFAAFASIVVLGELGLDFFGPKTWRNAAQPYISDNYLAFVFGLVFAYQAIFSQRKQPVGRWEVSASLIAGSVFGLARYLADVSRSANYHVAPLLVSPWRPVWTVALPLAWAAALVICPAIRDKKARKPSG